MDNPSHSLIFFKMVKTTRKAHPAVSCPGLREYGQCESAGSRPEELAKVGVWLI